MAVWYGLMPRLRGRLRGQSPVWYKHAMNDFIIDNGLKELTFQSSEDASWEESYYKSHASDEAERSGLIAQFRAQVSQSNEGGKGDEQWYGEVDFLLGSRVFDLVSDLQGNSWFSAQTINHFDYKERNALGVLPNAIFVGFVIFDAI